MHNSKMPPQPIPSLTFECRRCNHREEVDGAVLEDCLGEPPSMATIGELFDNLRCRKCDRKKVLRILDNTGRLLIDPAALKRCVWCNQIIPVPRLAAKPHSNVCVACSVDQRHQQ